MELISHIGPYSFVESQRARFMTGVLWREWAQRYPELFDDDDIRIAQTQAPHGKHFFEWLGAILLYETTGYLSLVEKYEFGSHSRKQAIVETLFGSPKPKPLKVSGERSRTQLPDLLVYAPDMRDWYFCEVKGPRDKLSPGQRRLFEQLAETFGRSVHLIEFRATSPTRSTNQCP